MRKRTFLLSGAAPETADADTDRMSARSAGVLMGVEGRVIRTPRETPKQASKLRAAAGKRAAARWVRA